jgi:hypothetical protein
MRQEAMVARDVPELTNGELCVLQWLRMSNGKATMSANAVAGNSLFVVPDRLLDAGYVKTLTDRLSPNTMHYILTRTGLDALELNERRGFVARRRRPRAGGPNQ